MKKSLLIYHRLITIFLFLFFTISAHAAMPISPSYVEQGASDYPTAACTLGDPCSLSYANTNATFGNVVYLLDTDLFTTAINPSNDGKSGNVITFAAYTGDSPEVKPGANVSPLELNSRSYIKIVGITFTFTMSGSTSSYLIQMEGNSNHNEISNCIFDGGTDGTTVGPAGSTPMTPVIRYTTPGPTHNWLHDNTFRNYAYLRPSGCDDAATGLYLGDTTNGNGNYNTIEDNVFSNGGHHLIEVYTQYNIIRNNVFHNEGYLNDLGACTWGASPRNGLYGNRNLQIYDNEGRDGLYNLFEGNRSGHAAFAIDGAQEGNITIASKQNIIRYNFSYYSETFGLAFKNSNGTNNRAYNNTLYNNGQDSSNYPDAWTSFPGAIDWRGGVGCYPAGTQDNILKNNLIYNSYSSRDIMDTSNYTCSGRITDTNNYKTANGDPLFTDPNVTDATSETLPDLTLQFGSGAIDNGTWLTQADGDSDGDETPSVTLEVDDALYFQDGTWGSALVTDYPDEICITPTPTVVYTNCVAISSINYGSDTITLASAKTWTDNSYIWLYKKSDGVQVLYGDKPDQGASEYQGSVPELSSKVISADGLTLTLMFSVSVYQGDSYTDAEIDIDVTNGTSDIGVTYVSGNESTTHIYLLDQVVLKNLTVDIDINGAGSVGTPAADTDEILENSADDQLVGFEDASVTNNSTITGIASRITISGGTAQ